MPRLRQLSRIQLPPRAKSFIPVGYYRDPDYPVQLNYEEYEVFRLLDYEGLTQAEAALIMKVSRPTITRIYERARKKIAQAVTEARQLIIEGGRAFFDGDWFLCERCESHFNNPLNEVVENCPLCQGVYLQQINDRI
ncbi:MAG: DUF134 domain-containing protein [Prolixibacteraceae bacterium]|nr:DUF134 domain-containing protein [Prolixibacteraceae bacterium]